MIHLELIKVENCFISPIVSIIKTYRTENYELFYAKSWDFFYKPGLSNTSEVLSKRFGAIRYPNEFKCLKKYYGIEMINKDLTPENLVNSVSAEADSGRPVFVQFEPYCSPWNVNYKKDNRRGGSHCCFLIGIDTQSKELLCSDPFYQTQFERWKIEEFFEGYQRAWIFLFDNNFVKDVKPEYIIRKAVDLHKKLDIFNNIRRFGDEIEGYKYLFTELEAYHDDIALWLAPYISNIREIHGGRQGFARTLKFLSEKHKCLELKDISESLSTADLDWRTVNSLITKAALAFRQNKAINDAALKNISYKIKEVADKEESLHGQLSRLCI